MEILTPERFSDPVVAYGYQRTIFEEVAAGMRPPTISITPTARHVGVTRRDTHRPGFGTAVGAANREGYPVLIRGSGGGATAADRGTFGFSIVRPPDAEPPGTGINERYDEAAALVLGAFGRLGVEGAEVGEVRDEFCPGDHSIRAGDFEGGVKLCGIAQRITRQATSVGGIVLVWGEGEISRILSLVYGSLRLPFRPEGVGSLRRAGSSAGVEEAVAALAEEAKLRYGAVPGSLGEDTLEKARLSGGEYLVQV